jgi:hypothetical protein
MKHADTHNILYPLQHGFRKGLSCETQLIEFVDDKTLGVILSGSAALVGFSLLRSFSTSDTVMLMSFISGVVPCILQRLENSSFRDVCLFGESILKQQFWTFIKHKRSDGRQIPPLKSEGLLHSEPVEKANILNNQFQNAFSKKTNISKEE